MGLYLTTCHVQLHGVSRSLQGRHAPHSRQEIRFSLRQETIRPLEEMLPSSAPNGPTILQEQVHYLAQLIRQPNSTLMDLDGSQLLYKTIKYTVN